ncbi:MAG TPA: alpha/beta fold hydrolase [Polyangiaceae bacterium]
MPTTRRPAAHPENPITVRETPPGVQGPARELWFEREGTRLFALEAGRGHPVVFIHGGLADHRAAMFRVGGLAAAHRLLAPDLRGSGRSVYAGALSWDALADDVVALLDHLELDRAVIGGTSMGSGVAIRFALRHRSRATGLILMSPVYPGADRPLPAAASSAMRVMAEAGEQVLTRGVEALRPLFEGLPAPIRDVALQMMLEFDAASVHATTRFLASSTQPLSSARDLASIEASVALLPGTDPQHPPEIAELYGRHLRAPFLVDPAAPGHVQRLIEFCAEVGAP